MIKKRRIWRRKALGFLKKNVVLVSMFGVLIFGITAILYGVFLQSLVLRDDSIRHYNESLEHLRLFGESGDGAELTLAQESFRNALSNASNPIVGAAASYNQATYRLQSLEIGTGKQLESLKAIEELKAVIAQLERAGRYDPNDVSVKDNLDKSMALKAYLLDKVSLLKPTDGSIIPLPVDLQSKEDIEQDDPPGEDDFPGEKPKGDTPLPPDY